MAIQFEVLGGVESELAQEFLLFGRRFSDAAQADLASVGGGQNDIGALQRGQQCERLHRRQGLRVEEAAG